MKEARHIEVEVLPPEKPGRSSANQGPSEFDILIGFVSRLMDSIFRVPHTKIRFGLNPIIGLIPGVGAEIGALISGILLFRSIRYRLPKIVIARMALNILINGLLKVVLPGDLVSVFFRSNELNYGLLKKYAGKGKPVTQGDWIYVSSILGVTLFLIVGISSYLMYAVFSQFRWGW